MLGRKNTTKTLYVLVDSHGKGKGPIDDGTGAVLLITTEHP